MKIRLGSDHAGLELKEDLRLYVGEQKAEVGIFVTWGLT